MYKVDKITLIIIVTRSAIAVIMVLGGFYLLAQQIPIPDQAWGVASLVLAALFGADAVASAIKAIRSKNW